MDRLNPYAKVAAEMRQRAEAERAKAKAGKKAGARSAVGQKFYESMMVESEYHKGGDDAELFENYKYWLGEEKPEAKPE